MNPLQIITKYYQPGSQSYQILLIHSQAVAHLAVERARRLDFPDQETEFIREAALLHDIGIMFTSAPDIGCFGDLPYICHGFKGHDLLLSEGFPEHALVCERHTGTGLTLKDIEQLNGILPYRSMEPVTRAEQLIAYCDKFFSKDPDRLERKLSTGEIVKSLGRFGEDKVEIFKSWHHQFNP
ncbi:MAG: HDIG domain-containing protein [Bacteroidales bacterium]|nr:HDIG domain-containing protein [Bacteroidales bacterium]